ncbi:MAG: DUF1844 domain-containing protein [Candidatus Omnitrophica bacterium]|nr:DUF1844 domain-containing protein [Candidatus Omnitrophota bacterium]
MDLHNRWGDKIKPESGGGLIGPDGQPLPSASPEPQELEAQEPEPQLDFFNYIASLGFQAMIFLGEVANPLTNKQEKNLKQAKFLIDTLVVIRDKTIGNLSKEEAELLNGSIYELQLRYVEAVKNEKA